MGKQGCQYFCVIATPERVLFATGSDRKVKELEDTSGAGMQVCMQLALACGWASACMAGALQGTAVQGR